MELSPLTLRDMMPALSPSEELNSSLQAVLDTIVFHMAPAGLDSFNFCSEPDVRFLGSSLCVNGVFIPLASRPLTLKLIATFFKDWERQADRDTILREVYDYKGRDQGSERMSQSYDCNLNKLISRTRKLLEEALAPMGWGSNINWLAFDAKAKLWKLWELRSEDELTPFPETSFLSPYMLMV